MAAEKTLTNPVAQLLERRGHKLIIPSRASDSFAGRGELPVRLSSSDAAHRRVDVVGASWTSDGRLKTAAVECKATRWAILDALGQAVQYQMFFDEVFIATPLGLGSDRITRSVLVELGLGHIEVDNDAHTAEVMIEPAVRWRSRYEPAEQRRSVMAMALGLAFRNCASDRDVVHYGFRHARCLTWFAEDIDGHIQWNAWHEPLTIDSSIFVCSGLNVEHADDVRRIIENVDHRMLDDALSDLGPEWRIEVEWLPNPPRNLPKREFGSERQANDSRTKDIFRQLANPPKGRKARLGIACPLEGIAWDSANLQQQIEDRLAYARQHVVGLCRILSGIGGRTRA